MEEAIAAQEAAGSTQASATAVVQQVPAAAEKVSPAAVSEPEPAAEAEPEAQEPPVAEPSSAAAADGQGSDDLPPVCAPQGSPSKILARRKRFALLVCRVVTVPHSQCVAPVGVCVWFC